MLNLHRYLIKNTRRNHNFFQRRYFSHSFRDYRDMDLYGILKVHSSSTQAEIKQAYYEMAKLYHPDANQ